MIREAIRLLFVDFVLTLFRIPGLESSSTSILALLQLRPFCSMKPILHSEVCFKSDLHSASVSPLLSSLVVQPREGKYFISTCMPQSNIVIVISIQP